MHVHHHSYAHHASHACSMILKEDYSLIDTVRCHRTCMLFITPAHAVITAVSPTVLYHLLYQQSGTHEDSV